MKALINFILIIQVALLLSGCCCPCGKQVQKQEQNQEVQESSK